MSTAIMKADDMGSLLERVVIQGDLSRLSPTERMDYYRLVCESVGLNPLTQPFAYITLNGKLALYALKGATDQLRSLYGVSITIAAREKHDELYVVTARATNKDGRSDESIGAVPLAGLKGDGLANAIMKAETKAKRRVTLSICGLGMLDETEVDTIPGAKCGEPAEPVRAPLMVDTQTGEVLTAPDPPGDPADPVEECVQYLDGARSLTDGEKFWKRVARKDFWETLSVAQQSRLTEAKDRMKGRLANAPA